MIRSLDLAIFVRTTTTTTDIQTDHFTPCTYARGNNRFLWVEHINIMLKMCVLNGLFQKNSIIHPLCIIFNEFPGGDQRAKREGGYLGQIYVQ